MLESTYDYRKSVGILLEKRENKTDGGGSTSVTISPSVVNKFNFPYFLTETELYNIKRTHFFCL